MKRPKPTDHILSIGDTINGFEVVEIHPNHIIYQQNGLLYTDEWGVLIELKTTKDAPNKILL